MKGTGRLICRLVVLVVSLLFYVRLCSFIRTLFIFMLTRPRAGSLNLFRHGVRNEAFKHYPQFPPRAKISAPKQEQKFAERLSSWISSLNKESMRQDCDTGLLLTTSILHRAQVRFSNSIETSHSSHYSRPWATSRMHPVPGSHWRKNTRNTNLVPFAVSSYIISWPMPMSSVSQVRGEFMFLQLRL